MKGLRGTIAVVVVLLVVGFFVFRSLPRAGRGSVLSRGPEGWSAARLYLEEIGVSVTVLDRSPAEVEVEGVLVEVFPWRGSGTERLRGVRRHVVEGGSAVLAYSGSLVFAEDDTFEAMGMPLRTVRDLRPDDWSSWRADDGRVWELLPEVEAPGAVGTLSLPAPRWAPLAPEDAEVLYRSPDGTPLAFTTDNGRGRLVVVPATALANASLDDAGNADLLTGLVEALGRRWSFDENAHGLVAAGGSADDRRLPRAFDLLLVHLVILYLLAAWTLSRRFGPPWRPRPAATGSVAAYLRGLGRLHHRLGHHPDAARKLAARWRELHPRLEPATESAIESVHSGPGLVAFGRHLSRRASAAAGSVILGTDPGTGPNPASQSTARRDLRAEERER